MRILIAGGTGFIGNRLTDYFQKQGHEIFILTRNPHKLEYKERVSYIEWLNPHSQPETELDEIDVCINLAGTSLNSGRWTKQKKQQILESRMISTREFIRIMNALPNQPDVFINASAIGYYGTSKDTVFTEDTIVSGHDFLAEVCSVWEQEAQEAESIGVRTVITRFGIILDQKEGALPKIALPYKLMFGGPLGNGEQWMSWIHIDDVIGSIEHIIHYPNIEGPVNITAPTPQRNKEFGKTLSNVLRKPHWLPAPSFALRTILGDMSILVLKGQYVYPQKLETSGYQFYYPTLQEALEKIYT
ncbi:TIGR01777 family oxidoreductase [Piscibacillus halophilus]|uniref:TIGR01777 family oxidoreductase n=1 Tax=Piscibacillus halophilus TaxID=571933 RepID=UPI001588EB02|nr:TIGR01777 family oxidoreductase [Piscibacillus halophilus]